MPMLGLGVWQVPNGAASVDAVRWALDLQSAGHRPEPFRPDGEPGRAARGADAAQVLLRWSIQRGLPVITKSTHRERIHENAQIFGFTLSDEDMAELDALDQTNGTDRALERKWW